MVCFVRNAHGSYVNAWHWLLQNEEIEKFKRTFGIGWGSDEYVCRPSHEVSTGSNYTTI